MPTYEYRCAACGNEFEMYQSIKDDPIKICPKCKSQSAERLISAGSGILFKGTGFYTTDYKKSNSSAGSNSSCSTGSDCCKSCSNSEK